MLNIVAGQIAFSWKLVAMFCTLPHNIQHIQGKLRQQDYVWKHIVVFLKHY